MKNYSRCSEDCQSNSYFDNHILSSLRIASCYHNSSNDNKYKRCNQNYTNQYFYKRTYQDRKCCCLIDSRARCLRRRLYTITDKGDISIELRSTTDIITSTQSTSIFLQLSIIIFSICWVAFTGSPHQCTRSIYITTEIRTSNLTGRSCCWRSWGSTLLCTDRFTFSSL